MSMVTPTGVNMTTFPYTITPIADIQPFSYQAGLTYQEVLTNLRDWLTNTLVPYVNTYATNDINAYNAAQQALATAMDNFNTTAAADIANINNVLAEANTALTNATSQATNSANSATAAATSETNAATSATNAASSATAAANSANNASVWHSHDVLNVKDYGAVGDGVTDDSTAVANAITAASGKALLFPSGVYMVHGLSLPANTALIGADRSAILRRNAAVPLITVNGVSARIHGVTFDGNGATETGDVLLIESDNFTLSDAYGYGAPVGGMLVHSFGNQTTVRDCRIDGDVYVQNADGAVVSGCRFYAPVNATGYGVGIASLSTTAGTHADNARITNNYFLIGTNTYAIAPISRNGAQPPRGLIIANNTIIANANCYGGITIDTCGDGIVTGNTFRVLSGTIATGAVEVVASSGITVTANDFDGGAAAQVIIAVNNSSDCIIDGNILKNSFATSGAKGVWVLAPLANNVCQRVAITNNKFLMSSTTGATPIYIDTNATGTIIQDVDVIGNTIFGSASSYGVSVDVNTGAISEVLIESNVLNTGSHFVYSNNDSGNVAVVGNKIINVPIPMVSNGTGINNARVESNSWQFATAAPTTGYSPKGQRVMSSSPAVGSPTGWVCTVAGTPGTWVALATL